MAFLYRRRWPGLRNDAGVYSTRAKAEQAVDLLREKPGFRDYAEGFEIAEGELDRTSMTEGFIRACGDE
jgi:hypothetical protein